MKSRFQRVLSAALSVWFLAYLGACARGTTASDAQVGVSSPPADLVDIDVEPADLVTNFGNEPIRVVVRGGSESARLEASKAVESTVAFRNNDTNSIVAHKQTKRSYLDELGVDVIDFVLIPDKPLLPAWYALELPAVPRESQLARSWGPLQNNLVSARFRPDSRPTLRAIRICEKPNDISRLTVEFSEPVVASKAKPAPIVAAVQQEACEPVFGSSDQTQYLEFDCPSKLAATWSVEMKQGLVAPSSAAAALLDGRSAFTIRVVPTELPIDGSSCHSWREGSAKLSIE